MTGGHDTPLADLLIGRLRRMGLRRMFGVPGGGSSMDIIDAGRRAGVDFVLSRREDAGAIMAAVTAWLSGAPGLALATKGPGLTAAANGIAAAYLDRAPMLFLSDGFGADERSYVSHQYFDQAGVLDPITKANSTLSGDDPCREIDDLLAIMNSHPKGPAFVELTGAAAKRMVAPGQEPVNSKPGQTAGDPGAVREMLALARRPVIVAGFEATARDNGGDNAHANANAVRHLAEALNVPALVTYMAKGVIPDSHDNFAGIFTGGQAEFPCVSEADLIILAGLDPVELIRKPWPYTAPVLDIGEVRHDKHYLTPEQGLYGPMAATINSLVDGLIGGLAGTATLSDWTGVEIAKHRGAFFDAMAFPERAALTPVAVVKTAADAFGGHPRLAVDAGAHMFSAVAFWPASHPHDVLISNGLATMAFALPAAIAAALHDPGRGAVAMSGDGGLMMCLGELVTAAQQEANITVIVFNDGALSLIDIKRQEMQLPDLGFTWPRPDFAAMAQGLGLRAWRADNAEDLATALDQAAADKGPCLIDVTLDPDGYLEQMRSLRG